MLTKQQKELLIEDFSKKILLGKATAICSYKGANVEEMTKLRRALREKGVGLLVIRKTLADLAFAKAGIKNTAVKKLTDQIAVTFGGSEVDAAKTIFDFSKKSQAIKLVAGSLESEALDEKGILALAKLPSKEELLAKLVGTLNAPVAGLVNVLSGNLRGLVGALSAIKEKKEKAAA